MELALLFPAIQSRNIPIYTVPFPTSFKSFLLGIEDFNNIGLFLAHTNVYYTQVWLGDPPQQFYLVIDTASSGMSIPDIRCKESFAQHKFNSSVSSSFKYATNPRNVTTIIYDTGAVIGYEASDTLRWESIASVNQTFLLVENEIGSAPDLISSIADGLLGVSFDGGINGTDQQNVIRNIINQNHLTKPVFSIFLNKSLASSSTPKSSIMNRRTPIENNYGNLTPNHGDGIIGGYLSIGTIASNLYDGDVTYLPVKPIPRAVTSIPQDYFWSFAANGVLVDTDFVSTPNETYVIVAISDVLIKLDTTTLSKIVNTVNNYVSEKCDGFGSDEAAVLFDEALGYYVVNCLAKRWMPEIIFVFGNASFGLGADDYVLEFADFNHTSNKQSCVLGIQPWIKPDSLAPNGTVWTLGSVFLKKWFSIYDFSNEGRGFTNVKNIMTTTMITTTKATTGTATAVTSEGESAAAGSGSSNCSFTFNGAAPRLQAPTPNEFNAISALWDAFNDSDEEDISVPRIRTRRQIAVDVAAFGAYGVDTIASAVDGVVLRISHSSMHVARSLIGAVFTRHAGFLCTMTASAPKLTAIASKTPTRREITSVLALGPAAHAVFETPNAGGDSIVSECASVELLTRTLFGNTTTQLLATEMDVRYAPSGGSMTDYLVRWGCVSVSVSVTRVFDATTPKKVRVSTELAARILEKKLRGIQFARRALFAPVRGRDCAWVLHAFVLRGCDAKTMRCAWKRLSSEIREGVVVIVTVWSERLLYDRTLNHGRK
ncbi:hypothetical protein HK100_009193 [Physocladia obscura]|uniref:Peptidase A1 domain-containing protein n=1 Tax=Physocladia obscura TaxID=109957 RepID=A0AAD5XHR6_9FUNG|nr:hypothetical protein HK100_009193 [Physocladia obscura]